MKLQSIRDQRNQQKNTSQFFISTVFIALIFLYSCTQAEVPENLNKVLVKAGANKKELEKVIQHYAANKKDSLKLKAAYFLIENIDGMQTLDTNSVKQNKLYFDYLNSIQAPYYLVYSAATKGIDSINASLKTKPTASEARYVNELSNVSSEFLIKNIDSAFYAWENMPWSKNVSFEDFCEYILPYRCTDTYAPNIRDFFLEKYRALPDSIKASTNMYKVGDFIVKDVNSWFVEDVYFLPRYPFLNPIQFSDLLKGRIGACNDANSVRVAALRALGIAATFDQIPNWGDNNLPHFWYRIVDPKNDTVKFKITNVNEDKSTQHLISASSFDVAHFEGTPSNIQVNYIRTVPKVYRQCFSIQKNSLAWLAGTNTEIPPYFQNVRFKDVTSEYLETANAKVALNGSDAKNKFAYLCVFDNQRWVPVAWSRIENKTAEFKDMGKNIVYLPAYYSNGEIIPAGDPFLLTLKGEIETIKPDENKKETVELFTKYPVKSYVILWESYMLGSRFQLANKSDLSDTVTVHTIQKLPFYETEVKVTNPKPFRYLIYQYKRPKEEWGDGWASEFQFYGLDKNGKEIKLKGKPIGNPGEYPDIAEKLFDDIPYNVYKPKLSISDRYVGIDLGANNATTITRIKYMPYTDDNAVHEGDSYKLFYWNNGWLPVAANRAKGKSVQFNGVPKNALLAMKHVGEGVQQRIFTYKNGRQVFW